MGESQPIIVNIVSISKIEMASLHLRYLPTAFSRLPGLKLLELYYDALSKVEDAFGWAVLVEGQVVGFACAVRNVNSILRRLIKRSCARLLFWYAIQILYKPRMLIDLSGRFFISKADKGQWRRPASLRGWYTYRPLVVDEAYRKHHLADLLTQSLSEELKKRGVPGVISIVERSNTQSRLHLQAHEFYEVWKGKDYVVLIRELNI